MRGYNFIEHMLTYMYVSRILRVYGASLCVLTIQRMHSGYSGYNGLSWMDTSALRVSGRRLTWFRLPLYPWTPTFVISVQ